MILIKESGVKVSAPHSSPLAQHSVMGDEL